MGNKEREGGEKRGEGERLCFQTVQHMVRLVKGAAYLHSPPNGHIQKNTKVAGE